MIDLIKIAKQLEALKCGIHNKNPVINVNNNTVGITACCKEFESDLTYKMDNLIKEQIDKDLGF